MYLCFLLNCKPWKHIYFMTYEMLHEFKNKLHSSPLITSKEDTFRNSKQRIADGRCLFLKKISIEIITHRWSKEYWKLFSIIMCFRTHRHALSLPLRQHTHTKVGIYVCISRNISPYERTQKRFSLSTLK